MASGPISFIDIAVLEDVRSRFAAGDALAILTVDLDEVLWANGPGAALLGYPDIESVMGASPGLSLPARRQIAATPGFPRVGRDKMVAVRMANGMNSKVVPFLASGLALPDGTQVILLAVAASETDKGDDKAAARRAIQGFVEAGFIAAMLDGEGKVAAASPGFEDLGIADETLAILVGDVAYESDRLVKRMIPAAGGKIPAGVARLTDDPATHLLLTAAIPAETITASASGQTPIFEAMSATTHEPQEIDEPLPSDADLPDLIEDAASEAFESAVVENAPVKAQEDRWYFSDDASQGEAKQVEVEAARPASAIADPVRFVWRTDAQDAFSSISDEFVQAVGAETANVIGRPFREVADELELDPAGDISKMLERRDTWSGRTVMWPITGTDQAVPVDLAALPIYNRDRVFEGFRGFGVVRVADAETDPVARGLRYGPQPEPVEDAEVEAEVAAPEEIIAESEDPFQGEVPAISITPEELRDDKVIRLAEHRPNQRQTRTLSPSDRSAFEEIRARLQKDFAKPGTEEASSDAEATNEAPVDLVAEVEPEIEEVVEPVEIIAEPELELEPQPEPEAARAPIPSDGFTPSAFSNEGGRPSIDPDLVAGLPIPLLIHAGDELYFANREFLSLTGYASLEQISDEGGLDALFVDCSPERDEGPEGSKLTLRTLGGEEFAVDAHLQSVRWNGRSALLLSLRRKEPVAPPAPVAVEPEPVVVTPAPLTVVPPEPDFDREHADMQVDMLRTIIDTATDGVVLINPDMSIRSISRPAEALFGFDSGEVEGKPFPTLFAIESRRAAQDYVAGLAGNGVASVLNDGREVIGREAQGRFIPLFMTIGKLPNDSGYCAVVRDITQWKRAEEELTQARAQAERASSQKTEFLARVSHEIRTPLNAIIGFSELMIDEKFGPIGSDRYRDYLRDINRSGNHVLDLVNDLLDISKIEAGEQEMNYEAVSLNDSLAETVAMMQPQANRERVIIRSSLASNLPDVVADLRSVRQIALNMLSNAIRYTQAGGQVIVSTSYETSGDVAMRIRDTGIGMTLAEIDQAMKPFKQINALKRGRHDGTGLGLPLTKAMVEANRARFTITSTPGEGTMVEIVFPSQRVLTE